MPKTVFVYCLCVIISAVVILLFVLIVICCNLQIWLLYTALPTGTVLHNTVQCYNEIEYRLVAVNNKRLTTFPVSILFVISIVYHISVI